MCVCVCVCYRSSSYSVLSSILFFVVLTDQNERKFSSLSTAEAVVTTAVVCVVCSFTAGLLLGVLLTQCHGHCHRKQKRGQTETYPVYEDIYPWRRYSLQGLSCRAMKHNMDQYVASVKNIQLDSL